MSNIASYNAASPANTNYTKLSSNSQKIQSFAKHLHDFLPVIEAEFDDLEQKSKQHPNDIFPIKMAALSSIYQAAQPLYEWYIEKAKKQVQ